MYNYATSNTLFPNNHAGFGVFGFNGKENDNEVYGSTGTFQDYGMRMYDTRVCRFISVDPLTSKYPELTPYQFAGNTPIQATDLDGLEPNNVNTKPSEIKPDNTVTTANDNIPTTGTIKPLTDAINDNIIMPKNTASIGPSEPTNTTTSTNNSNAPIPSIEATSIPTIDTKNASFVSNAGLSLTTTGEMIYSKGLNIWLGNDFKYRPLSINGNGTIGGKYSFAKNLATPFKIAGNIAGAYNVYQTNQLWRSNQISTSDMIMDQTFNALSFIPPFGTAASIGFNLGKNYGFIFK